MKSLFIIASTILTASIALAGQNNLAMREAGKYSGFESVGTHEQGDACTLEVLKIKKSLLGKIKAMTIKLNDSDAAIALTCSYDMENGKLCQGKSDIYSIHLNPREGYHEDYYPTIIYRNLQVEDKYIVCDWLTKIN